MNREAIARAERRRQALEALEFERARAAALRERLEAIVAELDGPALDQAVFAQLEPEDVELVRHALQSQEAGEDESVEADGDEGEEQRAWLEEEIVRLEDEVAASTRRQQAFERYLDVLGG